MSNTRTSYTIAASVVVAAGAFLVAGPLNPPTGPVSAGGKTTQEIYDAVTNIGGSIGAVGGRGPAVPGANRVQGSFSLTAPGGQSFSGPMLGLRLAVRTPTSGGVPTGQSVVDGCTIVRDISDGSASVLRLHTTNAVVTSALAFIPASGAGMNYTFSNVRIVGTRNYNIQRADGTFAAIEEFDLTFQSLTVADPGGRTYTYNLQNP